MRIVLFAFFICKGLLSFSQLSNQPQYYLNSEEIVIDKVRISPKQIRDIKVEHKTKNGEIYITTKNEKFSYYTLNDIITQDTKLNYQKENIVYKIFTQTKHNSNKNGELVVDTTGIKIDTSYYISITVDSLSSVKYLVDKTKTYLVNINLDTAAIEPEVYIKKPVIYLYPESEMDIHLKVNFAGELKTTYPLYKNGWFVHAYPSGELKNIDDGKEYSYLFWDGLMNQIQEQTIYESGYVIKGDTALLFLQNTLPKFGLKPREYNDFIVYWLPYLQTNTYTFIHFRTGENYNVISKNEVSPKPDNQIRVFMDFKSVDSYFKVNAQSIQTPKRHGFTLVEWGGAELKSSIKIKNDKGEFISR